jgi:cell division protein ZapA (FtsZ GTPase activity inhibitor)
MRRISKSSRQWLLGLAVIVTALLLWWVYDYEPRQSQLTFTREALQQDRERHEMLSSRLQRFSADDKKQQAQNKQLEALSARIVPGKSIEEVNAQVQTELQKFLDDREISLSSYQAMASGKWRDYKLGKMQFRLSTTTRKFSEVLEYLEKLDKVVSITGMNVRYQKRKNETLNVTLELSTLFMDKE